MEYIEKTEGMERVYIVNFDRAKLRALLDEIVRTTSYKVEGTYKAPYGSRFEGNVFTKGATLVNGDPMFVDIKKIWGESYEEPYDTTKVEGAKVFIPELANIIAGILKGKVESLEALVKYEMSYELVPIDEKITSANTKVDELDNYSFHKKIKALEELRNLYNARKNNHYHDPVLLTKYYEQARELIELHLVKETVQKDKKILLKNYRPGKK